MRVTKDVCDEFLLSTLAGAQKDLLLYVRGSIGLAC